MRRLFLSLLTLLALYLLTINLTGWIFAKTFQRAVPMELTFDFNPSLLPGQLGIKNVEASPREEVTLVAEQALLSYHIKDLLFSETIPFVLDSSTVLLRVRKNIGFIPLVAQFDFDTLHMEMDMNHETVLSVREAYADGPQVRVEMTGSINIRENYVDLQVRVFPKSKAFGNLLESFDESIFSKDSEERVIDFSIRGSLDKPMLQLQTDLLKVSVE